MTLPVYVQCIWCWASCVVTCTDLSWVIFLATTYFWFRSHIWNVTVMCNATYALSTLRVAVRVDALRVSLFAVQPCNVYTASTFLCMCSESDMIIITYSGSMPHAGQPTHYLIRCLPKYPGQRQAIWPALPAFRLLGYCWVRGWCLQWVDSVHAWIECNTVSQYSMSCLVDLSLADKTRTIRG